MVSLVTQTCSLDTEPEEGPTEPLGKYWEDVLGPTEPLGKYWEDVLSSCTLSSLMPLTLPLALKCFVTGGIKKPAAHYGQFNDN